MQRLLFLDWLRGCFIVLVILFHAWSHLLFWNGELIARDEITTPIIVLFAPLILLGTWAPIFALISGVATAYVFYGAMAKARERGPALRKHARGIYINSALLYLCSLIHMGFLHFNVNWGGATRYTALTGSIERGHWGLGSAEFLFFTDAVALMAMAGAVAATLLWLLWRGGGFERVRRNYVIIVALGIVWFAVSPLLHRLFEPAFFNAVNNGHYATAIALKLLIGPPHSTFPNAGFALFGVVFGIALARREPLAYIRRFGYGAGLAAVAVGLAAFAVEGVTLSSDRIGTALPVQLHVINLGLMMLVATWLIGRLEYQSAERRCELARKSTWPRRFGLMAMTVYICESFFCAINFHWFLPLFEGAPLGMRWAGLFLFGGMQLVFWYGLLRVWERYNFRYSFEWFVVTVGGWLRGRRSNRLDVATVLYAPVTVPSTAGRAA